MPGRHINDQQVRTYMRLRTDHLQATAAAKAGLSIATARRIEQDRRPSTATKVRRSYRTRADPLDGLWDEEIVPMLEAAPGLRPITLLNELARRYPDRIGRSFRRTLERRVGDPRLISLIRRWLKAGILDEGAVHPNDRGTPQGGSISVLLSNVYLHYVLYLWFERVVKRQLRGEAYLVRYIDDFVICFQYRSDALRIQDALGLRLARFGLTLEPNKTKLVEFGRFAQRHASKHGRNRPETIYFLGMTLYCTQNRKVNFKVGMRTEKSRLRRSLMSLQDLMRRIRHDTIPQKAHDINVVLRGHYAYYGLAGNIQSLFKVYRAAERYWRKMLCSRSWAGSHLTWEAFNQIKTRTPLLRPKLLLPYRALQSLVVL